MDLVTLVNEKDISTENNIDIEKLQIERHELLKRINEIDLLIESQNNNNN